ncbi:MAG: GCN5-related N-acetyltransferase [Bacteroidetes bacterium]|nr:GCN5-related N-acetyltransferase [Bacteroidota bacterium]
MRKNIYFDRDIHFMSIRFELKHFSELTLNELYAIMVLRQQVFVVEQTCAFLDADGLDQQSWHLICYTDSGIMAAYCRLLPIGLSYPGYASIGRVVSEPTLRKEGYGRLIMAEAIRRCTELFGDAPLKIGAQLYLKNFYESFGFAVVGDVYDEDGIDHIKMVRRE